MSILEASPNKYKRGGIWVEGQVLRGTIKIGDEVEIIGFSSQPILSRVIMFDPSNKKPSHVNVDCIKLLIENVDVNLYRTGRVLAQPKTISAHDRCQAKIEVLSPEKGGRTKPLFSGYRPQFYIYETHFACEVTFPEEINSVPPGWVGLVDIIIEHKVALETGSRFELREGAKVSVQGEVQRISDY